jgi:predicted ATP-dependent endonuclease of OLD family
MIEGSDPINENDYKPNGIKLRLFIQYTKTCNLENVSRVMMDLDPDNNYIVLGFDYILTFDKYVKIRDDYKEFKKHEHEKQLKHKKQKGDEKYEQKTIYDFLDKNHADYFKVYKKSIEIDKNTKIVNEANFIDLEKESISIKDIINFKYIDARREVVNKEPNKTLSAQTSEIYEKTETNPDQNDAVEDFKDRLGETDSQLSKIYANLFKNIIKKVSDFGGIKPNESEIEIISNLQHRELLKGNTTVVYKLDNKNKLPEYYNGLGYMNLISIIFEIEIIIHDFKREKEKKPADINLLFIEEPEAHTHPQMQYVFIKNIKRLIKEGIKREDGENRKLQYIISTHSSHIIADSDFNDIKYLKKESGINNVVAKNMKDLEKEYDKNTSQYQFLKQYLTISRTEIFFADKAILIEGDTERILIPAIMKKIDEDKHEGNSLDLPLLSQNISIIEVGAYSQIFDKFIEFLGIKTLIITDLDTVDKDGKKCEVATGVSYSNDALSHYFNNPKLSDLKDYSLENKLLKKVDENWVNQSDGNLCVVYQTKENEFNARSFEDAFIHLNKDFIKKNIKDFKGLKKKEYFDDNKYNSYDLAEQCIKKKTHFALDILFYSNEKFDNWKIPAYIKEGLVWLKQD